ncbi:MAG TPA: hypothetical protein VMG38_01910 [Trebonia sp.]|nr:hypothetical protein [Trebonia sp.]
MPAGAVLTIIIICVLIAIAAGIAATLELRMMATRRQFGPEFDRLAGQAGTRRARAELIARTRHVAQLDLRPLSPQRSRELVSQWESVQEEFVEAPAKAAATASELVLSAAAERGYPAADSEQLLADLSVAHARHLEGFRRAQRTTADPRAASTEDLRQALLGYRALFYGLTDGRASNPDGPAAPRPRLAAARLPRLPRTSMPRLSRRSRPPERQGANQA